MYKKIIFLLIIFLIPISNIKAYSNRYFNISIPKGYKITLEQDGTYQWVNSSIGSNYVISVKLRTSNADILDYSAKTKEKYIEGVVSALENQYYNLYSKEVPVELIYSDYTKINKYKALLIKVKIDNFFGTKKEMNQYMYILESKNFIYSFVYSTPKLNYNEKTLNNIKKSFIINDKLDDREIFDTIKMIIIIITSIMFGYIICIVRKRILFIKNKRK